MKEKTIRLLYADEIECRIATINEKGLSLLLYKDARVDQRILDQTFGIFGWKRSHQSIDGNLYCTVEIYSEELGQWIGKQDVGTEAFTEKEKSQCSDSFKRACFNIGIGRELYSAPFIWVPSAKTTILNKNGKYYCNDRFVVKEISYNDRREIDNVVIANDKGQIVFSNKSGVFGRGINVQQLEDLRKELELKHVSEEDVKERYKLKSIETMDGKTYERVMKALSKTLAA